MNQTDAVRTIRKAMRADEWELHRKFITDRYLRDGWPLSMVQQALRQPNFDPKWVLIGML